VNKKVRQCGASLMHLQCQDSGAAVVFPLEYICGMYLGYASSRSEQTCLVLLSGQVKLDVDSIQFESEQNRFNSKFRSESSYNSLGSRF
jgi:hypothetical protein